MFQFIKRLYEKQKKLFLKFVKKLTNRHLEPTKIERQNVQKALDIFSRPLAAALEALRRRKVSGFMGSEETISFMLKIIKWFEIHDVCNYTQAIYKRLPNKALFTSTDDARLKWLEDFLKWLKEWRISSVEKNHFLTSETFEAITITTKSTIAKISDLLRDAGFTFVLTRRFNSDNLERKFSALRQANGGNYNMDAKAAIYGLEKLLRTGITYSAMNCNVPLEREQQNRGNGKFIRKTTLRNPKKRALDVLSALGIEDRAVLEEFRRPPDYGGSDCDDKLATAVTAVFLLLVIEEREICVACREGLRHTHIQDPQANAINALNDCLNRGGLNIPSKEFVQRMWTIYRFVEFALKKLHNTRKTREDLISFLTPHIAGCSTFCCSRGKEMPAGNKHNEQLAILILWKFINPMLNGYAATLTDLQTKAHVVGNNKVVNRKFNTHSK
ncbi:uncharacterized protein LOC123474243 [Daphnia magna]|uniref:uncharacterized protein LOC123474243 n=1 Tax=Daphnia magna TaxID=35525 RepID=UPI001E1BB0AD|nr:uncharacterized protein LOC123474243 [Daphnia magna]